MENAGMQRITAAYHAVLLHCSPFSDISASFSSEKQDKTKWLV